MSATWQMILMKFQDLFSLKDEKNNNLSAAVVIGTQSADDFNEMSRLVFSER